MKRIEKIFFDLRISLSKYVADTIGAYDKGQHRKMLAVQLAYESKLVRQESMNVLAEFEVIS